MSSIAIPPGGARPRAHLSTGLPGDGPGQSPITEGGRPGIAASAGEGSGRAVDPKTARAVRDFQSLLLRELLRPLTDAIGQDSAGGESALGLSSGNDIYSLFWSEALASHLAGSWPMPSLPGLSTASTPALTMPLSALSRSALPLTALPTAPAASQTVPPAAVASARNAGSGPLRPSETGELPALAPQAAEASALAVSVAGGAATGDPSRLTGVDALAEKAARLTSVPVNLVRAVMAVESSRRVDAVSPRGAVGLMQLMPGTAKELGVKDPSDPWQNLVGGARYLARQIGRFGRVDHALAAYNAGPGAVERHGGIPPYRETRAYVQRVMAEKARLDQIRPDGA